MTLHGHICLIAADMVARERLMKVTGNRSYCYCEYCMVRGVWNGSLYCPMTPPTDAPESARARRGSGYPWVSWDREVDLLPMRTDEEFRMVAGRIARRGATAKQKSKYGIKGLSILSRLSSIDFPRSFPPDAMHLWFENIVPDLVKHWRGKFAMAKAIRNDDPYNIPLKEWEKMSTDIASSASNFPKLFGPLLRNFLEYINMMTAAEWQLFSFLIGPVYLKGLLPEEDYIEFISLIETIQLTCDHSISTEDLEESQRNVQRFSEY
ncbi:hypothetical protein P167DRAFT_484316, partial [Morchella conica CCBAS932]